MNTIRQMKRIGKMGVGKGIMLAIFAISLLSSWQAAAYTSESYVQRDHLIAQWDGIDNAGVGWHDPQATVWKDLKGNLDMTLTAKGSWNALGNALYVSGVGAQGASAAPAYKTIEIVYRMTRDGGRLMFCSGTTARWVVLDPSSGSPKHIYFAAGVTTPRIEWPLDTTNIHSVAATYSGDTVSGVFLNGATPTTTDTGKNGWGTGDNKVAVGGRKLTETGYAWTGEIYAIRLYDTVLTADEIAANKAIDDARFAKSMVSRYVQDGLVTQWDGIDNAGTGVHDPAATVWKDLKGNLDLTLTNSASWNSFGNGLVVNGLSAIANASAPQYKTIEVVYRRTRPDGRIMFNSGRQAGYVLFDSWTSKGVQNERVYFSSSGSKADGDRKSTVCYVKTFITNEVCTASARYDDADDVTDISFDGAEAQSGTTVNGWAASSRASIGDRTEWPYPWYGEVYAVRLYNRRLTRAELAENNRIDRMRFLSTDNYLGREALISKWDGANNFGAGVDYNPQASAWKDLAGTRDLVLTTNGSWSVSGYNGMVVNGASATNVPPPAYKTIEVAYRHTSLPKVDNKYQSQILFNSGNSGTQIVCYMQMGTLAYFSGKSADHKMVKWKFDTSAVRSMAATYTNSAATAEFVYGDGVRRSDATQQHSWSTCWARMILGDNQFNATVSEYRPWYGEVYALRLYDRALTDDEIAFNAALDKKRIALTPKTVTWAGGDGDFGTASNWNGGSRPHFNDAVVIPSGSVTSREDQVVGTLALGAEAALALKVTDEAVPITVACGITAETGAALVLDAAAFGKKHPQESVTLVSCGSASAAALEALAANVSFGTTPVSRRGTLAVSSDGTRLVYTAPPKPGMILQLR